MINWIKSRIKNLKKYPPIDKLPQSKGIIHHPTYGDYSEEIPFEEGMTLMPGQETSVSFDIIIKPKEEINEKNSNVSWGLYALIW